MRISKYVEDLKAELVAELSEELVAAERELFNLGFQNATSQLDSTNRITEVHENIVRTQTVVTEKSKMAWFVNHIFYRKESSNHGKKFKKNTYR